MRRWPAILLLTLGFLALIPENSSAQRAADIELNLFGAVTAHSGSEFETSFPQSVTPIRQHFRFPTGIRGGVRLNVFNAGHWGQEFVYSFEPSDATFDRRTAPAATLKLPIQIHQLSVNALYYPNADESASLRAFGSFGIGAMVFRPTQEALRVTADPARANIPGFGSSSELAFNYGIGLKSKVSRGFGVRLDARGFVHRKPSFDLPRQSRNPGDTVLANGGAMHSAELSGGIVFYFGR